MRIPEQGTPVDDVLAEVDALQADDVDWRNGRAFSLTYEAGEDVHRLNADVVSRFFSTNALNPGAYPSLGRMQSDVVAMVADLLHGGEAAAGFMTSGGTESILLAVKAARNRFGRERPNVVLPTSAHAAFTKAGAYFGVEVRRVDVDADYRADVAAMREAIEPTPCSSSPPRRSTRRA